MPGPTTPPTIEKLTPAQQQICQYLVPKIDVSYMAMAADLCLTVEAARGRCRSLIESGLITRRDEGAGGRGQITFLNLTFAGFQILQNHLAAQQRREKHLTAAA